MIIDQRNNNIFPQIANHKWSCITNSLLTLGIDPLKLVLACEDALSTWKLCPFNASEASLLRLALFTEQGTLLAALHAVPHDDRIESILTKRAILALVTKLHIRVATLQQLNIGNSPSTIVQHTRKVQANILPNSIPSVDYLNVVLLIDELLPLAGDRGQLRIYLDSRFVWDFYGLDELLLAVDIYY